MMEFLNIPTFTFFKLKYEGVPHGFGSVAYAIVCYADVSLELSFSGLVNF